MCARPETHLKIKCLPKNNTLKENVQKLAPKIIRDRGK
jgi:hypothetical protein